MKTSLSSKTEISVICHLKEMELIEAMLITIHGRNLVKTTHHAVPGKPFVVMEFSISGNYTLKGKLNLVDPVEDTQKTLATMMANSYRASTKSDCHQAALTITQAQSLRRKLIAWLSKD
ncbi:hypothetical protein ABMX64_20100 [Vibrio vulnificus]|uniref:hypothetical protein n=1 Tax=Vibrio vulnificus TaxID=672 RepID=UPI004059F86B